MTEATNEPPADRQPAPAGAAGTPTNSMSGRSGEADGNRRWRILSTRLGLEFAVVVFGVFVALWADARVAGRAERRIEAGRLEALRAGITTSVAELAEFIEDVQGDRALLRELLAPAASREIGIERSSEAVVIALLGGASAFQPQLVAYDDLRSSGELALLAPGVRTTLSAMDQRLRRLERAQQDLDTVQQLNFDPYAMRHVDLVRLLGDYLGVGGDVEPPDTVRYETLIETREFRNLAVFRLDLLTGVVGIAELLEEALQTASIAIDERLGQLR